MDNKYRADFVSIQQRRYVHSQQILYHSLDVLRKDLDEMIKTWKNDRKNIIIDEERNIDVDNASTVK